MKFTFGLVTFSLFFLQAFVSSAQQIHYSQPEAHAVTSEFNIIGLVKSHILIWVIPDGKLKNSEIVIYDKNMQGRKRVKTNILQYGQQYKLDFINRNDSFEVIYQYLHAGVYFCKRAVFNEEGSCVSVQQIDSFPASNPDINEYAYSIIKSADKKTFALLKFISSSPGTLEIYYKYFGVTALYADSQRVPFYVNTSAINGLLLNENGNLFLTLSKQEEKTYTLTMYKINLNNNTAINSLKQLNNSSLMDGSLNISEYRDNYTVCAGAVTNSATGIFLWQVNGNLEDIQQDTIITNSFIQDTVFKVLESFQMIAYPNKEQIHLFIRSINKSNKESLVYYNDHYYPGPFYNSNKFPQYYYGMNDYLTNNSNGFTGYRVPASKPGPAALRLFSIEIGKQKDIRTAQAFTGELDNETISLVNDAAIFRSVRGFNILFNQFRGNKKITGHITLSNDNQYSYQHLIVMNLKYHLLVNKTVQVDANNIIVPCVYKSKMVFARVVLN